MPIPVERVRPLNVPAPPRYTASMTGPIATASAASALGIARRETIRTARVYLTVIATNAPGGPIALNALNASALNILSDGVVIGTLGNDAAAIADGASIPLSAPDLDGGEHLVAQVVNTPAGAENLSTLRLTFVLEADPR